MQDTKIRVMIIEDSRLYQLYLRKVLERESCLEVIGIAGTGKEAREMAERLQPDVITLDLNLPDVTEFELLSDLLRHTKIPVIVVSSLPSSCERAIQMGARDFIAKIADARQSSADEFAILLQMKIKMQARLRRNSVPHSSAERMVNLPAKEVNGSAGRKKNAPARIRRQELAAADRRYHRSNGQNIIAIGASLGGTESTLELLGELPPGMPGIVIVQHMQVGYTKAYAMRLNKGCKLEVSEARDGERIQPGKVLVAESGKQLRIVKAADGYYVRCRNGDKVNGFCPSADVLFSSLADCGARGIGVILSGMGSDGVQGIRKLREKGFYTVGQSQESCAIFGMPKAAYEADALEELLNPKQIAQRLIKQCKIHRQEREHGR